MIWQVFFSALIVLVFALALFRFSLLVLDRYRRVCYDRSMLLHNVIMSVGFLSALVFLVSGLWGIWS